MPKPSLSDKLAAILNELKADSGTIHLVNAEGQLQLEAASGIPDVVLQAVRIVPVGKGMAGLAAERREPVNICNIQTDSSGDVRPGAKASGLGGSVAVPMLLDGRVAGVLGVASRKEREFTGAEVARLMERAAELAREVSA